MRKEAMLTRLTMITRLRAALTLALAYLLCVVGPSVALAFMDTGAALHCVTARHEHRAAAAQSHDVEARAQHAAARGHDGAAAHRHDTGHKSGNSEADGKAPTATCCGTFCLSAMPASPVPDVVPRTGMFAAVAAVDRGIAGRGPDRIDRPPIALLPL